MSETNPTWEDWVPEEDDKEWYSSHNPSYSGEQSIEDTKTEAARRFVSHWLSEDSHGFRIPGDEWGQSLLHWINHLVAATGPYETHDEIHTRFEAQRKDDEGKLFRVELHLDTTGWTDDFEEAEEPWLSIYTDNGPWVRGLPGGYLAGDPTVVESPQRMEFKVHELAPDEAVPTQDELNARDWRVAATAEDTTRFVTLTSGLSEEELDDLVRARVLEWESI